MGNKFMAPREQDLLTPYPGRSVVERFSNHEQVQDIALNTGTQIAAEYGNALRVAAANKFTTQVAQHGADAYTEFREHLQSQEEGCSDSKVREDVHQFNEMMNLKAGVAMGTQFDAYTAANGSILERPLIRDVPQKRRGLFGWLFGA